MIRAEMIKTITHVFFFEIYIIKIKTIKELSIKDWSSYFFKEMVNILDIEPGYFMINDFKGCRDGSILFNIAYCILIRR